MSPARVIKNTNCQQNGGCCVESTEHPKWISPSNSSPSPSSSERRSLPVIIRCVARIPLRVRVSRAQTRRNGPLSLIGPPCLLSPYRFCQGILTVRAGGGREESGGKEGVKGGELRAVVEGCSLCFQPPIFIRILGSRIGNAKMRIKNVCTQLNRIDVFSGKKTWA